MRGRGLLVVLAIAGALFAVAQRRMTVPAAPSPAAEASVVPTVIPSEAPRTTSAPPTETPTTPPSATPALEELLPILPELAPETVARLRAVHAVGRERGLRPDIFAKVGDSISLSAFFLSDFGCSRYSLGEHTELAGVVEFFAAATVPAGVSYARCSAGNPFTRASTATGKGWVAARVLTPYANPLEAPTECQTPSSTPLGCELQQTAAAVAIVMLGTNDAASRVPVADFRAALDGVIAELVAAGVVPIVSTIPPRTDSAAAAEKVHVYNRAVVEAAEAHQVPLLNYWRSMQAADMVDGGMAGDGVHPNVYAFGGDLGAEGLRYGFNQRNLTVLQMLARVKELVLDAG